MLLLRNSFRIFRSCQVPIEGFQARRGAGRHEIPNPRCVAVVDFELVDVWTFIFVSVRRIALLTAVV
jgi:hypothetical protein